MPDLRDGVKALSTLASRDLGLLWRQVSEAVMARELLKDVLPLLVETYGSAAGALAADWYDDLRAQGEVKGRFRAIPAAVGDAGTDALARWGVAPLFAAEPDWPAALSLVEGGLQRRIANVSRNTIAGSSVADPAATGWQRIGNGECDWCNVLIGRGAVYREASADFAAHDNCNCGAVPAWGGRPVPVKPYTPGPRQSQADYDRARQWMRENGYK